jgi:uncharacterized protein YndB with AHSA1/START domain
MQTNVAFNVNRVLRASNADVWSVLGDFGTEHRWTKSLAHCERNTANVTVGTVRTCTLPRPLMGRTKVSEQLVEYTPLSALTYELDGAAGPFASARSRWSTQERADGTTKLSVEGIFVPQGWFSRHMVWPLAKPMITRLTKQVMSELENYLLARALKVQRVS